MLFNSFSFLFFLITVFTAYWLCGKLSNGRKIQNLFLLVSSYIFYGWWDPRFLILIVISSLVDFIAGLQMSKAGSLNEKKPWLFLSIGVNIGMLGFFKYFDFFSGSLTDALSVIGLDTDPIFLDIVLPVGISFYTFQTMSYTLDVYSGKMAPCKEPISFFAFVAFFPQLVAGPIERAKDLIPQFESNRIFLYGEGVKGLRLILWGFFKKLVISDRLGEYVDLVYANPGDYNYGSLILASGFFGIQIYCDFSGYSNIAVGTARLFGFRLSRNFHAPFSATSLREFWSRWHITLTTWFRDYVYIPLGGNRNSEFLWIRNVMLVFVISGLWHGAEYGFLLWGFIHGFWVLAENYLGIGKKHGDWKKLPAWLITHSVILCSWVFFRAPGISHFSALLGSSKPGWNPSALIFEYESALNLYFSDMAELLFLGVLIISFFLIDTIKGKEGIENFISKKPIWIRWSFYYSLAVMILLFAAYGIPQRFIYFQF